MKNKQGFGLLGAIITIAVIAIVGSGGYYYSSQKSNTDDAQTENFLNVIDEAEVVVDVVKENQEDVENELNGNNVVPVGITVTSPQPNANVLLPVTVNGFVNASEWAVLEGEAGSVQIFDANDKAVSNSALLDAEDDWLPKALAKEPIAFEAFVGDRQMISHLETDTGYLLFRSAGAKNDDIISAYRVPVRFKRGAF